ncbi:uncharacterized protein [Labrus bergylta]|uniref:uncharacterized protein isoform X2 n=1 Tax=Labrus bergylta TaxID=56723 RepID=UPI0033136B8F
MSGLLTAIKSMDKEAAQVLQKADFSTDSDIKTLTRQDLHELFPGADKLKLRRKLFDKIHKEPHHALRREMEEFIPESLLAGLKNIQVLDDYLKIMKELKTNTNKLHVCLDTQIKLIEELREDAPQRDSGKGPEAGASNVPYKGQSDGRLRSPHSGANAAAPMVPAYGSNSCKSEGQKEEYEVISNEEVQDCTGKYKMVVSGTTFGAHQKFLDKVKAKVELTESSDNHKITILFCVVSSRVGSDVEAAMAEVKGEKKVILVLMHHLREPTVMTSARTWAHGGKYDNIVFHDNVFYHETVQGLLECRENDEAVSRIQQKLLEFCPTIMKYTSRQSNQAQDCTGKYKMVVSGTTFGAHQKFLDKVKAKVELTESSDYHKITILFCVVSSRVGSDVEAAMAEVKGENKVILVLMHHLREPTVMTSARTWAHGGKYDNIVFHDNVFYHETVQGLLECRENDEAVSRIQQKLLEFCPRKRGYNSRQSNQARDAEGGKVGGKSGKDGKGKDSDNNSSSWLRKLLGSSHNE